MEKHETTLRLGMPKQEVATRVTYITLIALLLILLFPGTAHAGIIEQINDWFKGLLADFANGLFGAYYNFIGSISSDTILTGSFKTMLGTGTVWNLINSGVHTLVVTLGESILALAMLLQLVKISQRIDGQATLPALKDIVFLVVFYVFFHWLITNSTNICIAVYDEINTLSQAITSDKTIKDVTLSVASADSDYGTLITMIILGLLTYITGLVAAVVAYVVALARCLQLYVMVSFSPIPFSLLAFEETRSYGMGFIKNLIAVCLAGTIIVFLLFAFPYIYTSLVGTATITDDSGAIIVAQLVKLLGVPIMLIISLVRAGSWARDLLGG